MSYVIVGTLSRIPRPGLYQTARNAERVAARLNADGHYTESDGTRLPLYTVCALLPGSEHARAADLPQPGEYARAVLRARAAFAAGYRRVNWGHRDWDSRESFDRELRTALDRRINTRGQAETRRAAGRKHDDQYQTELYRDARAINGQARFYSLGTPDLRARFGHLIATNGD